MGKLNPLSVVLIGSLLCAGAGPGTSTTTSKEPLSVGEKLVYDARVWKGLSFLGMSVAEATLEIRRSDRKEWPQAYLLHARAEGGALGYSAIANVSSYLDAETLRPVHTSYSQRGSEVYDKQILFQGDEAVYVKKKHCRDVKTCANPAHIVRKKVSRGFLRGYRRVREHCGERKCDKRRHYTWRIRDRHTLDRPTYDMLSVLYICRQMDLHPGGQGEEIRIVDGHGLWDVKVRATGRERIKVPAGKFRCLRIEISPKAAVKGGKLREEFSGLFGISGNIEVWVDEKTRAPVRIRGIVPFGVDLNMEISLVKQSIPKTKPPRPGA